MSSGEPSPRLDAPRTAQHAPTARATRTRGAILAAAEALFAENGFEATRLEDVAEAVGIRRASIVYYFRDKHTLYDAVLATVIESLERALASGLESDGTLSARIESGVGAWVDFLVRRPTFARILLRELASTSAGGAPAPLAAHIGGVQAAARALLGELEQEGASFPNAIDPAHFATAIAGATVFYAAALPSLAPGIEPAIEPEHGAHRGGDPHEHHRAEVVEIARRLLGEFEPRASREPA